MRKKALLIGKKFLSHELVAGSFYMFLGSNLANVFAFIFNFFLLRKFNISEYGEFASLISLISISVIPATALGPVIVQFATKYFTSKDYESAAKFYLELLKFAAGIGLIIFLLFSFASIPLKNFLHLSQQSYIFIAAITIGISYLSFVNMPFLQSLLKFRFTALITFLMGFLKTLIGIILILFSLKVAGALWAVLLSFFIPFMLTFWPLKFLFNEKKSLEKLPTRDIIIYAIPSIITVVSLASFTLTDVILVKHFFNSTDAGLYAGLSLVGKIIFYFTAPIPGVMFPLLIKRNETGGDIHKLFYLSILLVLIPSIFITSCYFLFPKLILTLFSGGNRYTQAASYLGFFGIYLTVFSIVNVLVNFFLSLKKTLVAFVVGIDALLQILLIFMFHSNFSQIITISLGLSLLLMVILLLYYVKEYGNKEKILLRLGFLNNPSL